MNVSKYFMKNYIKNSRNEDITCDNQNLEKLMTQLDKKYIDKKELINKINVIKNKYRQDILNGYKYKNQRILQMNELDNILKLI
jgi:hypothetical protein